MIGLVRSFDLRSRAAVLGPPRMALVFAPHFIPRSLSTPLANSSTTPPDGNGAPIGSRLNATHCAGACLLRCRFKQESEGRVTIKKTRKSKKSRGSKVSKKAPKLNWTLDHRANAKPNEEDFCERASLIWAGYRQRVEHQTELKAQRKPPPPPFDSAKGYFKRQAYELLRTFRKSQADRTMVRRLVHRSTAEVSSPSFQRNFYHWGLVAMYASEGLVGSKEIAAARKSIERMGREFLYASSNDVKPIHLIGFLYQSACSKNLSSKIPPGVTDPSLDLRPVQAGS